MGRARNTAAATEAPKTKMGRWATDATTHGYPPEPRYVRAEPVTAASWLASHAHAGVMDRNGDPYINHVKRVAEAVAEEDRVTAWLHDTIEDTSMTAEKLRSADVSETDIEAVLLLTRVPGDGRTYMQYIQALADATGPAAQRARRVKRADLLDNLNRPRPADMDGIEKRYQRALAILEPVIAQDAVDALGAPDEPVRVGNATDVLTADPEDPDGPNEIDVGAAPWVNCPDCGALHNESYCPICEEIG